MSWPGLSEHTPCASSHGDRAVAPKRFCLPLTLTTCTPSTSTSNSSSTALADLTLGGIRHDAEDELLVLSPPPRVDFSEMSGPSSTFISRS
jgi:hypothetical protein